MRFNSVARCESSAWSLGLMSLRSFASSRWYSNSLADPMAIEQKRANSASPFLPHPSAKLAGIEELHRRSLTGEPVQFFARKGGRDLIHRQRQLVRLLPDLEVVEILHGP